MLLHSVGGSQGPCRAWMPFCSAAASSPTRQAKCYMHMVFCLLYKHHPAIARASCSATACLETLVVKQVWQHVECMTNFPRSTQQRTRLPLRVAQQVLERRTNNFRVVKRQRLGQRRHIMPLCVGCIVLPTSMVSALVAFS